MAARSDMYRRLAIQAKQQRSRASDPEVRQGLADIADHWAGLAEESDWLEKRLASSVAQQQHYPSRHLSSNLPCNSNRFSRRSRKAVRRGLVLQASGLALRRVGLPAGTLRGGCDPLREGTSKPAASTGRLTVGCNSSGPRRHESSVCSVDEMYSGAGGTPQRDVHAVVRHIVRKPDLHILTCSGAAIEHGGHA